MLEDEIGEDDVMASLEELWTEVIFISPLGPDDDFFDLGGDSLKAVLLASQIQDRFGVPFSPADVFKWSILRDLAQRVHMILRAGAD